MFENLAESHPELAQQVSQNSPLSADKVVAGSHQKLLWVCPDCGFEWFAAPCRRTCENPTGCPRCCGHVVTPGFNDLATVNPQMAAMVSPNSPIKPTEVTVTASRELLWQCSKCGYEWWNTPGYVTRRKEPCPACSRCLAVPGISDLATTHPDLAAEVSPNSPIKATEVTSGSSKKLLWLCERGHEYFTVVKFRTGSNPQNCPYCSGKKVLVGFNDLVTVCPDIAAEVSPRSPIKATEVTVGPSKELTWRCEKGHEWNAAVKFRTGGGNCPYCSNRRVLPGFNDLVAVNPELAAQVSPNSPIKATGVTSGSRKELLWLCPTCSREWKVPVKSMRKGRHCIECTRTFLESRWEKEMQDFVSSLLPAGVTVQRNDRSLIFPLEVDLLIPGLKLAFEFNGNYWHSDAVLRKNRPWVSSAKEYHEKKRSLAAAKGVELFFVWELDWKDHRNTEVARIQDIVADAVANWKS